MRAWGDQKALTRGRILAETVRALREGGVRSVRLGAVMRAAGLTHGGFYAHFASLDALLEAAVRQMSEESEALARLGRHPGPAAAALQDFVDHYLSMGHCARGEGSCPLPILLPEAQHLSAGARAEALRLSVRLTEALAEILARLGHGAAHAAATRLVAEAIGLLTLARALPDEAARAGLLERARGELVQSYGLGAQ